MPPPNDITRLLDQVHRDWQTTQGQFPNNTHPPAQWPIPFFGNPATALVATIGVNPNARKLNRLGREDFMLGGSILIAGSR